MSLPLPVVVPDVDDELYGHGPCIVIEGGPDDFEVGQTVRVSWSTKPESVGMVRDFAAGLWSIQVKVMDE